MTDKVLVKSSLNLTEYRLITAFKVQIFSAFTDSASPYELSIVCCLASCTGEFLFTAVMSETTRAFHLYVY